MLDTTSPFTSRPTTTTLPWAMRTDKLVGSMIDSSTSLLAGQKHDIVRFAMGSPASEAIPHAALADIASRHLDASAFDYGATEGDPLLMSALLDFCASVGEPTTPDRLLITSGGMQGLDLACTLFVDPGDVVLVESPTYTNGTATVLSYGGDVIEAPMDENGLIVEQLEDLVAQTGRIPKMIYAIPTFQNPSGATLSLERRMALIELARKWGSILLDDDPYGHLRFAGDPIPSLRALAPHDPLVFSVRTFSKLIAPGLRVGWVDADPRVRDLMINAKQAMDTCTNVPNQRIIAEFIRTGAFATHLAALAEIYRPRKLAMQDSLRRHLGDRVTATDPDGGFFLWTTLTGDDAAVDTRDLFEIALAHGVAFIPGPALSAGGRFRDAMRLCFASSTPERIEVGVQRLAGALDEARSRL